MLQSAHAEPNGYSCMQPETYMYKNHLRGRMSQKAWAVCAIYTLMLFHLTSGPEGFPPVKAPKVQFKWKEIMTSFKERVWEASRSISDFQKESVQQTDFCATQPLTPLSHLCTPSLFCVRLPHFSVFTFSLLSCYSPKQLSSHHCLVSQTGRLTSTEKTGQSRAAPTCTRAGRNPWPFALVLFFWAAESVRWSPLLNVERPFIC